MTDRPVRVMQCLRIMNRAGLETWLMHLLRRFDRREIAMDFLVQTSAPGAYDEEIRSLGARIFPCLAPHRPWRYARSFLRILREHGPYNIVHSQNYFFAGADLRLAAFAGVGVRIAHIHPVRDLESERPFRALYRELMTRWIRKCAGLILAPSQATLEAFNHFGDFARIPQRVIRNCVDLSAYAGPFDRADARRSLGLPADASVIAYVARFEPHKNHMLLFDIADRLRASGTPAHFVVSGTDGSTRSAFTERAAARTDFSVFVDLRDVAPLLRSSDLFLFPSREEGFGTVAIEAAAAGLPVVATNLPGIREACAPAHGAFLFPEGNTECAANMARTILATRPLAAELRRDALQWAEQFSIDTVVANMRQIYCAGAAVR